MAGFIPAAKDKQPSLDLLAASAFISLVNCENNLGFRCCSLILRPPSMRVEAEGEK